MFDIGFSELLVIGIVALIVLGPERLPKVARTLGTLLGRLNRYASQVKQDIDREMQLEELRKMQKDMQETAQKYQILASERVQEVEATVAQETSQLDKVMQAMSATDGGLTMQEWEKVKAADEAAKAADGDMPALAEAAEAPATSDTPTTVSGEAVPTAESTGEVTTPALPVKAEHADYPHGPVG